MSVCAHTFSDKKKSVAHFALIALMCSVIFATGLFSAAPAKAGSATLRVQAVVLGSFTVSAPSHDSLGEISLSGTSAAVEYRLYGEGGELISSQYGTPTGQLSALTAFGGKSLSGLRRNSSIDNPVILAINY